jgi:hypothetical protein
MNTLFIVYSFVVIFACALLDIFPDSPRPLSAEAEEGDAVITGLADVASTKSEV